jgi:hypothetical protein
LLAPSHGLRIDGLPPQAKHTLRLRTLEHLGAGACTGTDGQSPEAMRLTTEATMIEPKIVGGSRGWLRRGIGPRAVRACAKQLGVRQRTQGQRSQQTHAVNITRPTVSRIPKLERA